MVIFAVLNNKLQVSKQSPLLSLVPPLTVGLTLGINYRPDWDFVILCAIAGCLLGLLWIQRKINACPWSVSWHNAFRGVTFCGIVMFGVLWGCSAMRQLDAPFAEGKRTVNVVVLEEPTEKAKTYSVVVQPEGIEQKLLLYIQKDSLSACLQPGDFLQVQSKLQVPQNFTPDFDYVTYLKTRGIILTGYVPAAQWRHTDPYPLSALTRLQIRARQIRMLLSSRLEQAVPNPEHRALVQAMLLGDKTDLTPEQKNAYTATGLSHLLALSGMHIGFIVLLLGKLTFWAPRWLRDTLTLLGTWAFIFVVGLPVSAVRAGLMLSLLLINPYRSQSTKAMDRWALAALIVLMVHPIFLLDVGFQLSFAAVAGILIFLPYFPHIPHTPRFFQDGLGVCLYAQLGVFPLTLWHFGTFPVYFLLTNLTVSLILTPLVMYLSIAVLAFGTWIPWLVTALEFLLSLQKEVVSFIQHLPGAQLTFPHFGIVSLLCGYLCIALLLKALIQRTSRSMIGLQLAVIALLLSMILEL